ncbi:DUF4262 domain-containing protein [Massilia sp. PAMC28688]|uniref:DUF4262 domain-containing protein n=1 Tax=Massilia sp. PAMC28688 TaxID=2861283 RepID=UPI001C6294FA|nr:DUF4262 domain-containing protein [Massilia sp. PAMC28688]QYF94079.1 DUF4262 domain-containing protein [Massilia sp. PAMC28688]
MSHTHAFAHWPFAAPVNAISYCTTLVVHNRLPILRVSHDRDGDWQFHDATTDDPGEPVLLCLGCVFERDATVAEVSDLPQGWSAWRSHVGAAWERWENDDDEDEEEDQDEGLTANPSACSHSPEEEAASEQRALADIDQYGLHIIAVSAEGDLPPFAYSIGITQTLGMPELIVIGLKASVAHYVLNECYRRMKAGLSPAPGTRVAGLLDGDYECVLVEMSPDHYRDYLGWALWRNDGPNFQARQIVYPNTANIYPWDAEATEGFKNWQPVLSAPEDQGPR